MFSRLDRSAHTGRAGGAKRLSPAGGPKKNTSWRVGWMRSRSTWGKRRGSQGPQAKTKAPACSARPSRSRTSVNLPLPAGGATADIRYVAPAATISCTSVSTAPRQVAPEAERGQRHARVDLVLAVPEADDARLPARAGAGVGRSVRVDDEDAAAGALQVPGGPGPEDAGADHRDVVTAGAAS